MTKRREPLALICSDLHLSDRTWSGYPDLAGDAYWALEEIVDQAINLGVQVVIAAGDLLDVSRPNSNPVQMACQQLRRLEQRGIQFWYVQGQHELDSPPWISVAPSVHLHGQTRELGPYRVHGLDYQPTSRLRETLQTIDPHANILVCHQCWQEFMGVEIGQDSLVYVPYVDLVITGDLHKRKDIKARGEDHREFEVISPGASHRRKIDEPDEHFAILLMDDGTRRDIRINGRPCIRSGFITEDQDLEYFLSGLPARIREEQQKSLDLGVPPHIAKPIVHLRYRFDLRDAVDRAKTLVGDAAFVYPQDFRPEDNRTTEELQQLTVHVEGGLLGCLDEVAEPGTELHGDLRRLVECVDLKAEFDRLEKEHFGDTTQEVESQPEPAESFEDLPEDEFAF